VLASPAAKWLGVDADRAGRVKINPDLSVPGLAHIFAIGDTVTVSSGGEPVPGIGDAAKQGGPARGEGHQGTAPRRHGCDAVPL